MPIWAISDRPGWFGISEDIVQPIARLPGVEHKRGIYVHRSHLPLIDHPQARKALAQATILLGWHPKHGDSKAPFGAQTWAARDEKTAALGFKLRAVQQQAIDFIAPRRGTLIGDEMRLGKTLSAIMSHDPSTGPIVIVAPLSTRAHWLGWLRKVFPGVKISALVGKTYDRSQLVGVPIVWAHYDIIGSWQALFEIGTLILDEAHLLTNRNARRTLAVSNLVVRARKVVALTGTPIWNRPDGLWSVLNLIEPGAWGNYYTFSNRYGAPVSTAHGVTFTGVSHEEELAQRMNEIMLRRLWKDAGDDVPAISRGVVVAEVSQAEQRKLDIIAETLKGERTNTAGHLASYRRITSMIKRSTVVAEAQKILARGESVVIWTWHVDEAIALHEKLGGYVIHGGVAIAERERRLDDWRASETPAPLIANMAVAQAGIDLSRASFAIFAELDYTPAVIGQAEMRTFAPTRPMSIMFVVANHVIDQRLVRALVAKLGAASPLGVAAAVEAIDALREIVMGPEDHGDVDRLLEDFLASAA